MHTVVQCCQMYYHPYGYTVRQPSRTIRGSFSYSLCAGHGPEGHNDAIVLRRATTICIALAGMLAGGVAVQRSATCEERYRTYCYLQVQCQTVHHQAMRIARNRTKLQARHPTEDEDRARRHTLHYMSYRHDRIAPGVLCYTYIYLMLKCMGRPLLSPGTRPQSCSPLEGGYGQETTQLVHLRAVVSRVKAYVPTVGRLDQVMLLYRGSPEDYQNVPRTNKGYVDKVDQCRQLVQIWLALKYSLSHENTARGCFG